MTPIQIAFFVIGSNLITFAFSHTATNRQIRKLLRRKTEGAFVEVHLHYEFFRIEDAKTGEPPFRPCLHITNLSAKAAASGLKGKRFDWEKIHSHWLRGLEIDGFYAAAWEDVQQYLKENP